MKTLTHDDIQKKQVTWRIVFLLVGDQNLVSVMVSAERIGIGIEADFYFSETETFFKKKSTYFS